MRPPARCLPFLEGGGAMGERIRAFDWASHPLGQAEGWPPALCTALSLCLNSSFPTAIYWGPEMFVLYNDAWSVIPAEKHPWMLGQPAARGWAEIWDIVGPQFRDVLENGQSFALYDQMLPMVRGGAPRETWWNYSLTPIRDAEHRVNGIFNQGHEITELVVGRREREAELARWREVFRQAPAPVALLRGPEHVFEFANDAYLRLVGGRELAGKRLEDALPEVVAQGFVAILDQVLQTGEPYLAAGTAVKLQRNAQGPMEERVQDFIYQPMRDARGEVHGILVLVTDVTDRARAESALRLTNWQLGEERARLAALIEAEKRAQQALRRFNEALEGHVKDRTSELTRALEAQSAVTDRLRAAFATDLIFQGFMDPDGTLRDANPVSLAAIRCRLTEVVGRAFWETPWFTATPGMPERVREAVEIARAGRTARSIITVNLPGGERSFQFSIRPVFNGRQQVVGLVPEALELAAGNARPQPQPAATSASLPP